MTGDTAKRNRVHHVFKILRNPKSADDLDKLGLAVFDIIELDEKPVPACADVFDFLDKCFGKGKLSHIAEFRVLETLDAVKDLFEKWVVGDGSEGLVVRHDQAGWFKLKVRHNIDAAIIGFSEVLLEKLFGDLGPRYAKRNGGYLRILKFGFRNGDNAPMALIELLDRPPEIEREAEDRP